MTRQFRRKSQEWERQERIFHFFGIKSVGSHLWMELDSKCEKQIRWPVTFCGARGCGGALTCFSDSLNWICKKLMTSFLLKVKGIYSSIGLVLGIGRLVLWLTVITVNAAMTCCMLSSPLCVSSVFTAWTSKRNRMEEVLGSPVSCEKLHSLNKSQVTRVGTK